VTQTLQNILSFQNTMELDIKEGKHHSTVCSRTVGIKRSQFT